MGASYRSTPQTRSISALSRKPFSCPQALHKLSDWSTLLPERAAHLDTPAREVMSSGARPPGLVVLPVVRELSARRGLQPVSTGADDSARAALLIHSS